MLFNYKDFSLTDERAPSDKILNGGVYSDKIYLVYTLIEDDITTGDKAPYTPYMDRAGEFIDDKKGGYINVETGAKLTVNNDNGEVSFSVHLNNEKISCWGLAFPFNFQGKKEGGGFFDQYLFNSPYVTNDRKFKSFYLTKPNGNHLLLSVIGDADGWKMDYSPFQGGQYFWVLKILAKFDKAYGMNSQITDLKVVLTPVEGYSDALLRLSQLHNAPYLYPDRNGGSFGTVINLKAFGECDKVVEIYKNQEKTFLFDGRYTIQREGEVELVPYYGKVKGAGITLYGYRDLVELYIRTVDAVDIEKIEKTTDANLCEHQCWAPATLRLLSNYKDRLNEQQIKTYENRLKYLYKQVMETDPEKAIPRRTILKAPYKDYTAYHIFRSRRLQEQFFGTTLFLDSYKYFHDEIFLEYAIGTMDSLLDNYQRPDGCLETSWNDKHEDYTTVCAPVIPIVDMAVFLKDRDKTRSDKYFSAAKKICEFLCKRGLYFPSEGGKTDKTADFLPDGSVSNTILNLLYYCKNVDRDQNMIDFAKKVMDFHENYIIKTPKCQMLGSTLRWWETLWEGDKDGPALNCGHAWTIWRAEADWLYYLLTGDEIYKVKALNGFGTNFAKIDEHGNSYAIYQTDDIVGGGFPDNRPNIRFKLAPKFPSETDSGLSRYVWIRASECFLNKTEQKF